MKDSPDGSTTFVLRSMYAGESDSQRLVGNYYYYYFSETLHYPPLSCRTHHPLPCWFNHDIVFFIIFKLLLTVVVFISGR